MGKGQYEAVRANRREPRHKHEPNFTEDPSLSPEILANNPILLFERRLLKVLEEPAMHHAVSQTQDYDRAGVTPTLLPNFKIDEYSPTVLHSRETDLVSDWP